MCLTDFDCLTINNIKTYAIELKLYLRERILLNNKTERVTGWPNSRGYIRKSDKFMGHSVACGIVVNKQTRG